MMNVTILTGKVDQLTIFGQVEFINGNKYACSNSGSGDNTITKVVGDFKIVGSEDIERLEIKLTPRQYTNHIKLSQDAM